MIKALLNADAPLLSERATEALLVSVLGLGAVFFVLAIIWLVLSLFEKIFHRETKKTKKRVLPQPVINEQPIIIDDGAVVAAISAAIAVILESESREKGTVYNGFRIVSFKRSDKGRSWTQKNR